MNIYKYHLYYEIAFSFFDIKQQIDCFEKMIKKYSKIKVERCLDIACGPSLQLRELSRRGYECIGLDSSPEMLAYLQKKAKEEHVKIETVQADMCDFKLEKKVDFAFIMMGSLAVESDSKFLRHLDSLAGCLTSGGLYLIQNKAVDWTEAGEQSWTMERNGTTVTTRWGTEWKDLVNQIYIEKDTTEVNDHGRKMKFEDSEELKFIFPQEFKTLVKLNAKFEFLGWWEGTESTWFLDKPLGKSKQPSNINVVLLRSK